MGDACLLAPRTLLTNSRLDRDHIIPNSKHSVIHPTEHLSSAIFYIRKSNTKRVKILSCTCLVVHGLHIVPEEPIQPVAHGHPGKLLGADVHRPQVREPPLVELRVRQEQVVADGELQDGVADELEPLVGRGVREGGVRQGLLQQRRLLELVVQDGLHGGDPVDLLRRRRREGSEVAGDEAARKKHLFREARQGLVIKFRF